MLLWCSVLLDLYSSPIPVGEKDYSLVGIESLYTRKNNSIFGLIFYLIPHGRNYLLELQKKGLGIREFSLSNLSNLNFCYCLSWPTLMKFIDKRAVEYKSTQPVKIFCRWSISYGIPYYQIHSHTPTTYQVSCNIIIKTSTTNDSHNYYFSLTF